MSKSNDKSRDTIWKCRFILRKRNRFYKCSCCISRIIERTRLLHILPRFVHQVAARTLWTTEPFLSCLNKLSFSFGSGIIFYPQLSVFGPGSVSGQFLTIWSSFPQSKKFLTVFSFYINSIHLARQVRDRWMMLNLEVLQQ